MKTLISWVAQTNDFHADQASEDSPNLNLHQYYYAGHDRHILLSTLPPDGENAADASIRREYRKTRNLEKAILECCPGHRLEIRYLDIRNVIDLEEIFQKVEVVMTDIRKDEIDIFFSPGTSIMQVVWFIFQMDQNYQTSLIQGKKKEFNDGKKPAFFRTEVRESLYRHDLLVKNAVLDELEHDWTAPVISPSIEKVFADALAIGSVDHIPCLITGPSGAGKEVLARYLYQHSVRKDKAFVTVNSGAVPDSLLQSLLFGHRKGAFTGAEKDHKGFFEEADQGTLFLDEVGDIGPLMQLSLLRFLQQGEIQALGSSVPKKVNVRVIAATNADLKARCREGRFRWDLYYRLARTRLHLPALKDRSAQEVLQLTDYFLEKFAREFGKARLSLSKEARQVISTHPWPGNVRELENLVINLYVFCREQAGLAEVRKALDEVEEVGDFLLESAIQRHVQKVYRYFDHNKARTADALGVSRNTLYKYLGQTEGE